MATDPPTIKELEKEEKLVAELELLGIRYLSRQTDERAERVRPPEQLLGDLMNQPSARVRIASIAVLIAHPDYAEAVPEALKGLSESERLTLQLFYTAAMLLQQEYADPLKKFITKNWRELPDLFSNELSLSLTGSPKEQLAQLGQEHQHRTGVVANWAGTYHDVAKRLLRQWELEIQWSQ